MSEESISEAEYRMLLDEANRQIEEGNKRREEVERRNFEAFIKEEEIPNYRDAVAYLNMYEELKQRTARRGAEILCPKTNRHMRACQVALKREAGLKAGASGE